ELNVITYGSNLAGYKAQLLRVASGCAGPIVLATSLAQTGTGLKTFTFNNVSSSGSATDRFQVRVLGSALAVGNNSTRTLDIQANTTDYEVRVPWTATTPTPTASPSPTPTATATPTPTATPHPPAQPRPNSNAHPDAAPTRHPDSNGEPRAYSNANRHSYGHGERDRVADTYGDRHGQPNGEPCAYRDGNRHSYGHG